MAAYDIELKQGTTQRLAFKATSGGVPMDFTGCNFRMQIRRNARDANVLLELADDNGKITVAGDTFTLIFLPADTVGAVWTSGVYDLEITFANGDVMRVLEGKVSLSLEVTR